MQANELFDRPNTILLDGGMGTMLQAAGLKLGARPEELNITDPALIESIHARYAAAGSRIINANTFGASAHKLAGSEYTLEEIIAAGIANCKRACAPYGALAALDVGPLGELLEPNGTLAFEDAVAEYGRIVRAGVAAGADLVFLETFTDLYELKAALLAVKENSSLPVLASMSFEAGGRTFTGCTVESFAATARGLGADAVGINCSLGPKEIFPMAKRLTEALPGSFPVFVKPNAGLPRADGSGYDITPQLYAMQMKPYRELGLFAAGGCCGTTPEFIQLLNGVFADCRPGRPDHPMKSVVCSPMDCVDVDGITVVGERINPTGKKRFQQALREGDMNYVLEQAVSQTEAGAQILDVNVGAPGVDEPALMEQVVKALQSVVSLPLQLDSSHAEALERGLRVYNGKPIVNSVNGEEEKLNTILPLCKKYGAAVVGLAIDERGILPKAEDRVAIARRIRDAALAAGIPQEDIYIDCLTLTASAQQEDVLATVQALHACKEELGVRTILGVSNISFGLPCRSYLNTTFLTMAMYAGLDLAIMNPSSEEMMAAVYAYNVLTNRDRQSTKYIERYANRVPASAALVQAVQNAQTILLYAAFGGEAGLAGFAAEAARYGVKFAALHFALGLFEMRRHERHAARVAYEYHFVGKLFRTEMQVKDTAVGIDDKFRVFEMLLHGSCFLLVYCCQSSDCSMFQGLLFGTAHGVFLLPDVAAERVEVGLHLQNVGLEAGLRLVAVLPAHGVELASAGTILPLPYHQLHGMASGGLIPELSEPGIYRVIVHDKAVFLVGAAVFQIPGFGDAFAGIGHSLRVGLALGHVADAGQAPYLFLAVRFEIVHLTGGAGHKTVDADIAGLLIAVCYEPADVVRFVNDHQVVVGRRVEGHSHVFGLEEGTALVVVARDEYVVAAQTLVALRGEVERHAVGHHEGVILYFVGRTVGKQWYGGRPFVAQFVGCDEPEASGGVGGGIDDPVAKLVDVGRAGAGTGGKAGNVGGASYAAALAVDAYGRQHLLVLDNDAVDDNYLLGAAQHFGAHLCLSQILFEAGVGLSAFLVFLKFLGQLLFSFFETVFAQ